MSENVKEFNEENFNSEVMESQIPVLVDFWAEWCGPCKMLLPTIEQVANDYNGKVSFGKVNVDDLAVQPYDYFVSVVWMFED